MTFNIDDRTHRRLMIYAEFQGAVRGFLGLNGIMGNAYVFERLEAAETKCTEKLAEIDAELDAEIAQKAREREENKGPQ